MKRLFLFLSVAALVLAHCPAKADAWVYETGTEFHAGGDFNGDDLADLAIVDKSSGKIRLGYQGTNGLYNWINQRKAGLIDVADVSIGRLFDSGRDSLVLASANDNQVIAVDASNPELATPPSPVEVPALGPNAALAIDIGGEGNNPLDDLLVSSIYNIPDENMLTLMRNTDGAFEALSSEATAAARARSRVVRLSPDGPELVAALMTTDGQDTLELSSVASGTPTVIARTTGLPPDSHYVFGRFLGRTLPEFLFYQPGSSNVIIRQTTEADGGLYQFSELASASLDQPIQHALPIPGANSDQLLAIYTGGTEAAVLRVTLPGTLTRVNPVQPPAGEVISGALPLTDGFFLLSTLTEGKPSMRYRLHQRDGITNSPPVYGSLPTLADADDTTVPAIHERIVAALEVTDPAGMKTYTNTIPGSAVNYVMIPIPGGEFTMGSPETEAGRKPDESPQHQVKISPFWMGQFEITWNEFELFLYADDEKKLRNDYPTPEEVNAVSDAVTRPSKPYADMTFGMGREQSPAVSMTQHAANKYCHWLSAKTGHFYRLPTEAEWEYACRAGTTTAYSFGDDASQIEDYAWYEFNSDFSYHKVGRKKPNPWGLHDMHGNVAEWCLDQYVPNYNQWAGQTAVDPWVRATEPYPHVVRGGSYDDQDVVLRSAARRASHPVWKMRDPQLPKSIWWFTDAQTVGFRIVRPLAVPSPEEMTKYWISGVEKD